MANFIECTIPSIVYLRGQVVINHAINIDLCTRLRKSTLNWYPDNTGKPSVEFDGCDAIWVFETVEQRDKEYSRVVYFTNGQHQPNK